MEILGIDLKIDEPFRNGKLKLILPGILNSVEPFIIVNGYLDIIAVFNLEVNF